MDSNRLFQMAKTTNRKNQSNNKEKSSRIVLKSMCYVLLKTGNRCSDGDICSMSNELSPSKNEKWERPFQRRHPRALPFPVYWDVGWPRAPVVLRTPSGLRHVCKWQENKGWGTDLQRQPRGEASNLLLRRLQKGQKKAAAEKRPVFLLSWNVEMSLRVASGPLSYLQWVC